MNKNIHIESILIKVSELPERPGVYQYIDEAGIIIYVGKAKNIRKRVTSYFGSSSNLTPKTRILVKKICDIRFIVVDTESDALLLENNLIKQYRPKYNVMLKDDKTYPRICITNETFPRIILTRHHIKDGSIYFGPFSSVYMAKTLLNLIGQIFQIRTCKLNLSKESIRTGKWRECLEYHIKNCKGPCIEAQDEQDYIYNIEQIKKILRGDLHLVEIALKDEIKNYASEYKFEEAESLKQKLLLLEKYQKSSAIVDTRYPELDIFSFAEDLRSAYVHFLKIRNGNVVQSYSLEMVKRLDESPEELLTLAIIHIRELFSSDSNEIIVPFPVNQHINGVQHIIVPKTGDKKKLLDLSEKNVKLFQIEQHNKVKRLDPERHTERILGTLQKDLRLQDLPSHIECFDNSNIQGTSPVSACVVFKNGKPSKADYRHFHVKTVIGANDYATMDEVITRRYTRLIEENDPLPQLVIVDGGKGQLGVAIKVFEKLGIRGQVALIGLAERLEEIYFPEDSVPLYLDKNSESLKLIQHLRNEAHRFGLSFHRKTRSKNMLDSFWMELPGIGEKSRLALMAKYQTLQKLKSASEDELSSIIGKKRSAVLYEFLNRNS